MKEKKRFLNLRNLVSSSLISSQIKKNGTHQVNFCVAHKACDDCMDLPIDTFCLTCSTQQF